MQSVAFSNGTYLGGWEVQWAWRCRLLWTSSKLWDMVSWNMGTPKSSILAIFSLIHYLFLGTPICGNPHIISKVWLSNRPISGAAPLKDGSFGLGTGLTKIAHATCTSLWRKSPTKGCEHCRTCMLLSDWHGWCIQNLTGTSTRSPMAQHRKHKSKTEKRLMALHLWNQPPEITRMNQLPKVFFS